MRMMHCRLMAVMLLLTLCFSANAALAVDMISFAAPMLTEQTPGGDPGLWNEDNESRALFLCIVIDDLRTQAEPELADSWNYTDVPVFFCMTEDSPAAVAFLDDTYYTILASRSEDGTMKLMMTRFGSDDPVSVESMINRNYYDYTLIKPALINKTLGILYAVESGE